MPTGGTVSVTSTGGCNGLCVVLAGPYCGDGIVETNVGEQCDDGNRIGGDGCSGVCLIEPNWTCPTPGRPCVSLIVCGNGVRQTGECCDDGNTVNGDGCNSFCSVEAHWYCQPSNPNDEASTSACTKLVSCGDGIVQMQYGETCDLGSQNGVAGSGCTVTCGILGTCGDGVIEPPETCDDGINDCSYGGCTSDCQLAAYCGDGVKNGPEQCDYGAANAPFDNAPYGSCLVTLGPYCGDGVVQDPPEQCDMGVANGPASRCSAVCTEEILE